MDCPCLSIGQRGGKSEATYTLNTPTGPPPIAPTDQHPMNTATPSLEGTEEGRGRHIDGNGGGAPNHEQTKTIEVTGEDYNLSMSEDSPVPMFVKRTMDDTNNVRCKVTVAALATDPCPTPHRGCSSHDLLTALCIPLAIRSRSPSLMPRRHKSTPHTNTMTRQHTDVLDPLPTSRVGAVRVSLSGL